MISGRWLRTATIVALAVFTAVASHTATLGAGPDPAAAEARLGREIKGFTLRDFRGKEHSLGELADSQVVVVAFLGTECPLAVLYGWRLAQLHEEFAPRGVAFLGVDANQQDSNEEIEHYGREHNIQFPLLRDSGNVVADQFSALRTPEVFVLDRERRVCYWGRIDDQYGISQGQGYQKQQAQRRDLAVALEELLAGKPVSIPATEAPGCHIGRLKKSDPQSSVTWSKQISRIFQRRCQGCHRPGQIAPFPLLDYQEVVGWSEMIREVVQEERMPPWNANPKYGDFVNDPRLSDEEKTQITDWVRHGAPEGNQADLPPPARFSDEWNLCKPDQLIYMSEEPFQVPAEGVLDYQYFTVDPGFKEDKWLAEAEARPGCLPVVHHMAVFVKPPGDFFKLRRQGKVIEIGGYVPGSKAASWVGQQSAPAAATARQADAAGQTSAAPKADEAGQTNAAGQAWVGHDDAPDDKPAVAIVPAGYELVFEMHYTANGSVQFDHSAIALKFANLRKDDAPTKENAPTQQDDAGRVAPLPVRQRLSCLAHNTEFAIPPYAADYPVEAWYTFEKEAELIWMHAHMHWRGKSFRFEAFYPNGEREILLDVPRYNFDWQMIYMLRKPKVMPLGTRLHCVAHYDNSAENLRNPDPTQTVCYGHQTWDEMMSGTFAIVCNSAPTASVAREEAASAPEGTPPTATTSELLRGYLDVEQVAPDKREAFFSQRALYLKQKKDFQGAFLDFTRALALNAKDPETYFERGQIREEQGDFTAAADDFSRAVALDGTQAKFLVARGSARVRGRDVPGGIADLDEAVRLDSRNATAFFYRSVGREMNGDIAGAVADLTRVAHDVNPGFPVAHYRLGLLLMGLGQEAAANQEFAQYLEFEPDRKPEVDYQIGIARLEHGRLADAAESLISAVALQPEHAEAHFWLGITRLKQQQRAAGMGELREAVRLAPRTAVVHLELGLALAKNQEASDDEIVEAMEHYRLAMQLAPGDWRAANNLAWLLATHPKGHVRNGAEAVRLAEGVCQATNYEKTSCLDTLAAAYAEVGRFEDAVKLATRGINQAMAADRFALAVEIQERRRLYRDKQPFRNLVDE